MIISIFKQNLFPRKHGSWKMSPTLDLRSMAPQDTVLRIFVLCMLTASSGVVLEKVAEFFYYNYKNRNAEDVPDMEIPPELCLELLMAADFLDSTFHSHA